MTSGAWGSGTPSGDGQEGARGTAGADAAATPKGSALTLISWASALLTILCVVLAFVVGVANGLLLLATIFAATFAWSVGAFTSGFWVGELPDELDFIESVQTDITALDKR